MGVEIRGNVFIRVTPTDTWALPARVRVAMPALRVVGDRNFNHRRPPFSSGRIIGYL